MPLPRHLCRYAPTVYVRVRERPRACVFVRARLCVLVSVCECECECVGVCVCACACVHPRVSHELNREIGAAACTAVRSTARGEEGHHLYLSSCGTRCLPLFVAGPISLIRLARTSIFSTRGALFGMQYTSPSGETTPPCHFQPPSANSPKTSTDCVAGLMRSTCGLTPATSALGLGSPLPHLRRGWAHPCHICTRTGLTPATSALGLGPPRSHSAGTGLTPATSALGLGSPLPHLHWDSAHPGRILRDTVNVAVSAHQPTVPAL